MTYEQRAAQFLHRLYELTEGDITKGVDYQQHQADMGLAGLERGQWHEVTKLLSRSGLIAGGIGNTIIKITQAGIDVVRQHQR